MNWGYKIALTLLVFFGIMTALVIGSFQQNIDLVTEDYYTEELKYEEQIIKQRNRIENGISFESNIVNGGIEIVFPRYIDTDEFKGEILLYRPSQAKNDRSFALKPDSAYKQIIPTIGLLAGKYILKIDWKDDNRSYFQEIPLIMPDL